MAIRKITTLETAADFKAYLGSLGLSLGFDETVQSGPDSPLAQPLVLDGRTIGNRFAVLPMEGWDATIDGHPTELSKRRWQRFGLSGAKLIFGVEAVAVRPDARSSPHQMMISKDTVGEIAKLREALVQSHEEHFGKSDDLMVGMQMTHSGRVARPYDWDRAEPIILYHHPVLDPQFGLNDDYPVLTDDEISRLVEDFIKAAVLAQQAGFDFVDVKHCHGYLGHEFLSAIDRPGRYGGSFENRTRFLREVVAGIRAAAPGLGIAVRFSAIDFMPFRKGEGGVGEPAPYSGDRYPYAFGGDGTGVGIDLTEPVAFLDLLNKLDIKLVSVSAGAAYNAHILRPALLPDLDDYLPPEDPLVGAARLISVAADLKRQRPNMILVGAGYSYLQEWLPNVAQYVVRNDMVDFVGIGRMALSYPDIAADVLTGKPLKRRKICRTCTDCNIAPNACMPSGCYSLDDFFKKRPEYQQLKQVKREMKSGQAPGDTSQVRRRL